MTNSDLEKMALGEDLLSKGWQQGTLFQAPSISFSYHDFSSQSDLAALTELKYRNVKKREKLILISQDCDIKAEKGKEPYIEALICTPVQPSFIEKVSQLSSRWFVVDSNARLVAEAKYKIQIAKEVLFELDPEPWPESMNRLDAFVRWLARRYDRPALPDKVVEIFQKPIEQAIKDLKDKDPDIFIAFNDAIHNIRVNLPANEDPPFDLQLIFLVNLDGITEQQANAIKYVQKLIPSCLDTNLIKLDPVIRILTEEQISVKEYNASRSMYFDYYTYKGDEIEGKEPYRRV